MADKNEIPEIRAEVLLNQLFPDRDHWEVTMKGTFYRGYNYDLLEYDDKTGIATMTRDGFMKLLPQGLLARELGEKDIKSGAKIRAQEREQQLLKDAFMPIDNYAFSNSLQIEKQVSKLLSGKLNYILKEYFDFDMEKETNPLVRKTAVLLPIVSRKRGDLNFVRNLLESLFMRKVTMTIGSYSEDDNSRYAINKVRYEVAMSGLTTETFKKLMNYAQPLCDFISEWFIPFDMKMELAVGEQLPESERERTLLDYNTSIH